MEAALSVAIERGRTLWPEIDLAAAALARYVEEQSIPQKALESRPADLFLVAGCALGNPAAIAVLEQEYLGQVGTYVGRLALSHELLDELRQVLRIRLLADRPPRIVGYKGTGPLGAWVRVAAVRVALDLLDGANRQSARADDRALAARVSQEALPETELILARYRPVVERAVEQAIASLSDREKAVLRFHYAEGLNIESIGTIYRVHRSSVARWLVDIRERLLRAIQDRLEGDLRVTPAEFESFVGAVRDQMRVSILRILGATG